MANSEPICDLTTILPSTVFPSHHSGEHSSSLPSYIRAPGVVASEGNVDSLSGALSTNEDIAGRAGLEGANAELQEVNHSDKFKYLAFPKPPATSWITPSASYACGSSSSSDDDVEVEAEKVRLQLRLLELESKRKRKPSKRPETRPSTSGNSVSTPVSTIPNLQTPSIDPFSALEQSLKSIVHSVGLPKLDVARFTGDPLHYHSFVIGFERNIADRLPDDTQRLNYLVHYCTGKSKEAIQHCLLLPSQSGYARAKDILRREFGRPHDIVQAVTKNLVEGSKLRAGDTEGLKNLVTQMRTWHLTLSQLSRPSEVDCSTNLVRIVYRLPRQLQEKWAEVAESIIDAGREPSFCELLEFVERRVSVASSLYGKIASASLPQALGPSDAPRYREELRKDAYSSKVTALRVYPSDSPQYAQGAEITCVHCDKGHELQNCIDFIKLERSSKLAILREHKRCFRCLKPNHTAQNCKVLVHCTVHGCRGRHHTLMHLPAANEYNNEKLRPQANCGATVSSTMVALGFVPVRIQGPTSSVITYALVDNGSDSTLILESLAKKVGLEGTPKEIRFTTLNSSTNWKSQIVSLRIQSLLGDTLATVNGAYTAKVLPYASAPVIHPEELVRYPHLRDVHLLEHHDRRVGLLIGCDLLEAHVVLEQRVGRNNEPFATLTPLGWIVRGTFGSKPTKLRHINCIGAEDESLSDCVARFYELEFKDDNPGEKSLSVEDHEALSIAERTTNLIGGKYVVGLPRRPSRSLPDNYLMAVRRLELLMKRLLRDPELRSKYIQVMNDHELKGYVSKAYDVEGKHRWFLPHHPVIHPNKPGKVRIVFDCAASIHGESLNSALLSGPDLTNDLTGVLLRFRKHEYAVCADVQEMFLQVQVPEDERHLLSFLWWPDGNLQCAPEVYHLNVHPFGATSSPFCATYALRRTTIDNEVSGACHEAVHTNFYVDDCLLSVSSVSEAKQLVKELSTTLSNGGFKLTKWNTNDSRILSDISERELSKGISQDLLKTCTQSTLGLQWNTDTDCFQVSLNLPQKPLTRRGILSCVSSLYDPLGFVAPMTVPAKILLQELCLSGMGWDTALPEPYERRWRQWLSDVTSVRSLSIPRCLGLTNRLFRTELHMFCDASELGYGAVGYLRIEYEDGTIACNMLMGKARIAPKRITTLPRLELVAALLSSKLMYHLSKEIKASLDDKVLWSDSMIVLRYLSNRSSRFATFVANRVRVIQQLTAGLKWRHVPSEYNPADVASRGTREASCKEMNTWLRGPEFLVLPPEHWPQGTIDTELREGDPDVRAVNALTTNAEPDHFIEVLASRFSSWIKFLKCLCWLRRFTKFMQHRLGHTSESTDTKSITLKEMDDVVVLVVRVIQRSAYPEAFSPLKTDARPQKRSLGALNRLCPILSNGVLYLGGRVSTLEKPALLILPPKTAVTDLIIRHNHVVEGHVGASHVLAAVRRHFWVVKGMASVRRVLRSCNQCKLLYPNPCGQVMAPLPTFRTSAGGFPFRVTGVDYFGPFRIKFGRNELKRYGCLFTCMQTRAVHLEVAHTMSTDSFIMALLRFISRRGAPEVIFSDNGTNFVGADRELQDKVNQIDFASVSNRLICRNIEWRFNPPFASHRGGVWERMIRSFRRVLAAVTRMQVMSDETLITYMSEVERIVNDRPLIPVYDDPTCPDVLRPSDLLLLRSNPGLLNDHIPLRERYTRGWRQAQHLANVFWKRWGQEYLPTLQHRSRWTSESSDIKVGELVLLLDSRTPRGSWPRGVITEVSRGNDDHVRQVRVRTADGVVTRDIRSLSRLEGVVDNPSEV